MSTLPKFEFIDVTNSTSDTSKKEEKNNEMKVTSNNSELTKKLELAKCLTKESLDICEHIFMEFNIADNDSIMNIWFNKVAGPLVNIIELFAGSIKAYEDFLQQKDNLENNVDITKLETILKTEENYSEENLEILNYESSYENEIESKIEIKSEKILTNANKQRFACDTCDKSFAKNQTLKHHKLREHSSENTIQHNCEECKKSFSRKDNLKEHILRKHSNKVKREQYCCELCGMKFKGLKSYKKHGVVHGEKPFSCSYCEKKFRLKSKFIVHERIHTGERPYICDFCGKSFHSRKTLTNHNLTHTGQKSKSCDICGKLFMRTEQLSTHKKMHTGEKPLKCDVCDKSFRVQSHLNNHKMLHTGERPFSCDVCGKGFIERKNFVRHKMTHTGERPYSCDICNSSFYMKSDLNRHNKTSGHLNNVKLKNAENDQNGRKDGQTNELKQDDSENA